MRGCARTICTAFSAALLAATAMSAATRPPQQLVVGASFEIVAGERFGRIRETTARAALPSMFPPTVIQDTEIYIAEGFCTDGTRVFPGSADEIDLAWQDAARSRVAFVRTLAPNGRWATSRGVRVGSLLTELERLSGNVLVFSGFGWDYGGGLAWREATGSVGLSLAIDPMDAEVASNAPGVEGIRGDRPVRSDHPLVRQLRIRVTQITQSWGNHFNERDCG